MAEQKSPDYSATGEVMEAMTGLTKEHGLFLTILNNGDWMAGPASYIYGIKIWDDHYQDPMVAIDRNVIEALRKAALIKRQ